MKKVLIITVFLCILLIIVSCNKNSIDNSQIDSTVSEASSSESESEVQESSASEISEPISSSDIIDEPNTYTPPPAPSAEEYEEAQAKFNQYIEKIVNGTKINKIELSSDRGIGRDSETYVLSSKNEYIVNRWCDLLKKAKFKAVPPNPATGGCNVDLSFFNTDGEAFPILGIDWSFWSLFPYDIIENSTMIELENYKELKDEIELLSKYMGYPLPQIDMEGNISE